MGATEITFWIVLSVTAGICEETVFRGYLQRQFMSPPGVSDGQYLRRLEWTACEFSESEQGRRDIRKCTPNKLLSWFVRAWR
jgi:Type II CAAX prenyl endopeptidase Rce1-like